MTARERVEQAMDEFIRATGGNLDRRAANNRTRKALRDFFSDVSMACNSPEGVEQVMNAVIDNKPYFTCDKEFRVYDYMLKLTHLVKKTPKD